MTRKGYIANTIIAKNPKAVGIYRLVMKAGSDNFRASSIKGVMKRVRAKGIEVHVYAPELKEDKFFGAKICHDLEAFQAKSDFIISDRVTDELEDCLDIVFSRDFSGED